MRKFLLAASILATAYAVWHRYEQTKSKQTNTERARGKEAVADWENEGGAVKGAPANSRNLPK